MNRILKIVGGPLKGAEIALVAGTKVKVGSGDDCDVLISDPTLEKFAFELDVAEDEVTLTLPDGAARTLLDFEVREFGSSAFAVGPAEGVWQELVWPEKRDRGTGNGEEGTGNREEGTGNGEQGTGAMPPKEDEGEEPETKDGKKPSRVLRLVSLVLAVAAIVLIVILILCLRSCRGNWCASGNPAAVRAPCLAEIAERYALKVVEADGKTVVTGDFRTRGERLRAAAEVYSARPGADLDFADDESMRSGADDLLQLVTEGRIEVVAVSNRLVTLKGYAASAEALRDILAALDADVPHVERVDCTGVTCGSGAEAAEERPTYPPVPGAKPRSRRAKSAVSPNLPVCGILTTPYRCLILKDGGRILEGGEFGGCIVERISADAVTLRNAAGAFEWRP